MKVYEKIDVLDKNGNPRKMRKEIINPSQEQKWFYFIETKQIHLLEDMIKEGSNINKIDTEGQTIAHYSLLSKSKKLFDLCLNHQANFNVVDLFEVNPSKIIFQKNYNLYFFKNIIKLLNFPHLVMHEDYRNEILFLVNYDSNLPKVKFLFSAYPLIMEPMRQQLTTKALEREAIETWKYLSGRGDLILNLNKNLSVKEKTSSLIKI